jgi:hypothetical protein
MQDMQGLNKYTIKKPVVFGRTFLDLEVNDIAYFNSGGRIIEGRVQRVIDKEMFSKSKIYLVDSIREILKYGIKGTPEELEAGKCTR